MKSMHLNFDNTTPHAFAITFSLAIIGTLIGEIHTAVTTFEIIKNVFQFSAWTVGILVGASTLWTHHKEDIKAFFKRLKL